MSETLYARVANDLTAGIAGGRFPVGSVLPTELELCAHYGASRHTIRAAMRELQDLGLVSRRKKAGTRVEASAPSLRYSQSLASVEDLVQFGRAHTRSVQETAEVELTAKRAADLGCAAGSRWFRISSLRSDGTRGSRPVGWTDVYVDPAYAEIGELVRAAPDTLISTLIARRYGRAIAEIRQEIQAVALPTKVATALDAEAGAPALRILRHYLDAAGTTFEISATLHPAGRFAVSQRLRRGG